MYRKKLKRIIHVGDVAIGGDTPISIQSMTNTKTHDVSSTVKQILALEKAGCNIIRLAVPDLEAAYALKEIKQQINIPLIADIHFDYKLAIQSINNGVDGLRLNPGNIGSFENVLKVVNVAKEKQIPIRIGVNSGSLSKDKLQKYGLTAQAIVESALEHVAVLEKAGYEQIKISVKCSDVTRTIESYRLLHDLVDYPLHVGVTESGTELTGAIKSSVGIGTLLAEGIGDTIRVSLTSDPIKEIFVAKQILQTLGLRKGLTLISCPTCGRTRIPLIHIAQEVEKALQPYMDIPITVAVMGCEVNGPGEAKEADLGIAGGNGVGLVFRKGVIVKKVDEKHLIQALLLELEDYLHNN